MTDPLTSDDLGIAADGGEPAGGARGAGTAGRTIARAGLIVTAAYLASRVLGYIRVVVIGATFGIDAELDAFFAAFSIPDLLFQLVAAGALSSALVPIVAGLCATDEERRAWRVASTTLTLMVGALGGLAAVVFVAAPVLVPPIVPGFDEAQVARTVDLTRIMVLSPMFLAAGAVATSVLNATGRFAAAAAAPLVYNLAIIGGALILGPTMGVTGLAVGVVAGAVAHIAVQVPGLRAAGIDLRPRLDLGDPAARRTLVLLVPRAVGLASAQLVFVVTRSLASLVGTGAITAFSFAFAVLQIPIGVIGVPLGIVLLPTLSREVAQGAGDAYARLLVRGLRLLAFVMVPLAVLGIVVADDVVQLLFGHGDVDAAALALTASALSVVLVGMTAHALIAVLARAFYARQDTRTPVAAALVAVALDIGLAIALSGPFGLRGIAAAIAIGAWVEASLLAALLVRRVPGLDLWPVLRLLGLVGLLAAAGGAVAWVLEGALVRAWGDTPGLLATFVRAAVVSLAGGAVVVAGAVVLRVPELRAILDVGFDLVRRRARA